MDLTVSGRRMNISDSLRDYANEKIGAAIKQIDLGITSVDVVLSKEKNPSNPMPCVCEVTVVMKGNVARVEENDQDMFAAIDVAAAKITRQLRKYKTRVIDRRQRGKETRNLRETVTEEELDLDRLLDEMSGSNIARRKKVTYRPMSEDDAIVAMDLLGHDFYVYTDINTDEVCVLYRRSDGMTYGVISPK